MQIYIIYIHIYLHFQETLQSDFVEMNIDIYGGVFCNLEPFDHLSYYKI